MTTDVERLAVLIEANTRSYERAMTKLERTTNRSIGRANHSVRSLDRTLKTASASAATFMANFARGAGIAALTGLPIAMQRAVSSVAELGNAANRAGASAEALQVFRRALEQNGASAADADDAFRRLTRRMGEFANSGSGPAKAAIEGLGLSVFDTTGAMRSSDEILRQIAQRFGEIENPAIAAAYAAQLFGDDAGPRLVPLLMQGERALDSFEAQLRDANALMSNDSVQAAIAMDDAYNRLIDNMGLRWMGFVVGTVQNIQDFVGATQEAAAALNDLFESSQTPQDRMQSALASRDRGWTVRGDAGFAGYFDRSSFNMPSANAAVDIVDPRQAQALRELTGQLAAAEANTRRVTDAFALFGETGTDAAQRVGSAVQNAAGEPLNLLESQLATARESAEAFNQSLLSIAQGGLSDIGNALEDGKVTWQEWAEIGLNAINQLLGSMNQMNGGGGLAGFLGGLLGGSSSGSGIGFGPGTSMPFYEQGTNYVPNTGLAMLHEGEAVIPAKYNNGGGSASGPSHVYLHLSDDLDARIDERSVGNGVQIVRAATPGIVNKSVAATGGALKGGQMDGAMSSRFGVAKTARPR